MNNTGHLTRNEFIYRMNRQIKPIRAEYGFTQETMAGCIGISKKTLIEIEKGRSSLGWSGAVVLRCLFAESETMKTALSDQPDRLPLLLAFGEEGLRPRE